MAERQDGAVEWCFEITQGGISVASGSGTDFHQVRAEMLHYATMYAQDGPVVARMARSDALEAE